MIEILIIVGTIFLGLFFIYLLFDMRKFNKRLEREGQEYIEKLLEIARGRFGIKGYDASEMELENQKNEV